MGPIDPHQLLQTLSPLLHDDGGLNIREVAQVTNLMKDANKLVSRCIYVNILKSTKSKIILEKFMEVGGWEVLNSWLVDANNSENNLFLLEILRVYKELPVTVDALKQNNSAKIIKTLSRGENEAIKKLSREVVSSWMKIIKNNQKISEIPQKKNKIKEMEKNLEREEQTTLLEPCKTPEKKKRSRPEPANVYRAKSRDLGLEQEACKPFKKSTIARGKDTLKRIGGLNKLKEPIEKKIKQVNLNVPVSPTTSNSTVNDNQKVIKLISPKARSVHIISESTGFMSALDAPAVIPTRKKRKLPFKPAASPPSATSTLPSSAKHKLLFYKDSLETAIELEEDDISLSIKDKLDRFQTKENIEDGEAKDFISDEEKKDGIETVTLSHLRKKKKKSVTWAEEVNLCQFFFFDLDEAERVNVNHVQNFGDLKTQEMRLERQGFENAKRLLEDKMTEKVTWAIPPLLDLSTPLIKLGINSVEKEVQHEREQRVLQEIFFSKESLPDSPHEADLESIDAKDPKVIPLEENNAEAYTTAEPYPNSKEVSSLPPALANLVMSISSRREQPAATPSPQDINKIQTVLGVIMGRGIDQLDMKIHPEELQNLKQILEPFQSPPLPISESLNFQGEPMNFQGESNYQGSNLPPNNLLGIAPPGFKPLEHPIPSGSFPQDLMPEMPFPDQRPHHLGPIRGQRIRRGRGPIMRGHGRGRGGPERSICRYFSFPKGCRYNNKCSYIHPGVNEPL